jgi:nucleotide-binding universal stress UspA family protein
MIKHLLVPLDGSRLAESVLPAVSFLAEKLKASVTLVHVVEKNAPAEVHGEPHLRTSDDATAYLERIQREALPDDVAVDTHVHTTEVKNVAESIVQHVGEFESDLIIMCTAAFGTGSLAVSPSR